MNVFKAMHNNSSKLLAACAVLLALIPAAAVTAQKRKGTWMELPKKQAEKTLEESPWSHTQIDTDTSEMFYSPTKQGSASAARSSNSQASVNDNRADRGAVNTSVSVKYRICFLSAKPIREAFAKMVLASQGNSDDKLIKRLQGFIDRDFSPYIVVAVNIEASDQRFLNPIMQVVNSANTGVLQNTTYLERQDGKRLFLASYIPPIKDGLGAKFIFPRSENGEFFLTNQSESVRFVAEFSSSFKLNMRFKVADMMFDDKLEY